MANNIPSNLKYTSDHEWALLEGDTLTIGITDFAQSQLGDIVFVELPELELELEKGSAFGVVESIKSVSDLLAPVSGQVIAINSELEDTPESLNKAPYDNWMIKIKVSNIDELTELLSVEDYQKHCE